MEGIKGILPMIWLFAVPRVKSRVAPGKPLKSSRLPHPTVNTAFRKLDSLGFVHEMTGNNYGRLYAYTSVPK